MTMERDKRKPEKKRNWPEDFEQRIAQLDVVDFEESIDALKVKVKPHTADDPTRPRNSEYCYMLPSIGYKGLALILNIVDFESEHRRDGSERDMEYLCTLLLDLDYKVYPDDIHDLCKRRRTKQEMQDIIEDFREKCAAERPESIIVFIGSHGLHNRICTSDSHQYLDLYQDIVYQFSHDLCPELKGKPKIFLVQACQNFPEPGWIDEEDRRATRENMCIRDVLVFTASIPGTTSNRDALKGSWLPYCFTYAMMESALKMKSLQEILSMVGIMMEKIEEKTGLVQIPVNTQFHFKDLYFSGSGVKLGESHSQQQFKIPAKLHNFFSEDKKLCIVQTEDIQITLQKIRQHFGAAQDDAIRYFDDYDKFRKWMFSSEEASSCGRNTILTVVNDWFQFYDETISEFRYEYSLPFRIHQEMGRLPSGRIFGKLVFLTSCSFIEGEDEPDSLWRIDAKEARAKGEPINKNKPDFVFVKDSLDWEELDEAHQYKLRRKLELRYRTKISPGDMRGTKVISPNYGEELIRDTSTILSSVPGYYIGGSVMTRSIMSRSIFQDEAATSDIFAVENMEWAELQRETGNRAMSIAQLRINTPPSPVKFVWLQPSDSFEEVCSSTDSTPVHLLRYERGKLRWVRSNGEILSLYGHMAGSGSESQMEWDEITFFLKLPTQSNDPICISGGPGTGKSLLLAHMGWKLTKIFMDRTVVAIRLCKFMEKVKEMMEANPNQVDAEMVENVLKWFICKFDYVNGQVLVDPLSEAIANSKLHSEQICIELLMDDWDEANRTEPALAWQVLRIFRSSFKSVRLWLTSRPELLEELEGNLEVLGFKIKEFEEGDRIKLLTSFWSSQREVFYPERFSTPRPGRLEEFAKYQLDSVQRSFPSIGVEIKYTPLECNMLGEVMEKKALEYAGNDETQIEIDGMMTLTKAFEAIIDEALDDYFDFGQGTDVGFGSYTKKKASTITEDYLLNMLGRLAIHSIFPDQFPRLKFADDQFEHGLLPSVHLFKWVEPDERFIHQSFAEYFVASFIMDRLRGRAEWEEDVTELLVDGVLKLRRTDEGKIEFVHPLICYFFNELIADLLPDLLISETVAGKIKIGLLNSQQASRDMAHACAYANFGNILQFLDEGLKAFDTEEAGAIFASFSLDMKAELLKSAVQQGKFKLVGFLLGKMEMRKILEGRDLHREVKNILHHCVRNTATSEDEITQRAEILTMLYGINNELKRFKDEQGRGPELAENIHPSLKDILDGFPD